MYKRKQLLVSLNTLSNADLLVQAYIQIEATNDTTWFGTKQKRSTFFIVSYGWLSPVATSATFHL